MDKLIEILTSIRPDIDFNTASDLIDNEVIDSFDIIAIVGELNNYYDVNIGVEELVPENFNSASAILGLIERLKK